MRMLALVIPLLAVTLAAQGADIAPDRVTFVVTDDEDRVVAGASIRVWFGDATREGAHDRFEGLTDTTGCYVAFGRIESYVGAIVHAPGHYGSRIQEKIPISGPRGGRPWEGRVPVRMKKIRSPCALFARFVDGAELRAVGGERVGLYLLQSTVALDLMTGSVVRATDGAAADFSIGWNMEIVSTNASGLADEYVTQFAFSAVRPGDGLFRAAPDGDLTGREGSALVSAYEAPADGYTNTIVIHRRVRDGRVETNDDGHYLHYFRIRSQMNERGEVTNALYGKIYGPLNGNFRYYLNPTPNDRNVEFDPGRNLFEDLDPLERVTMP